MYIFAPKIYILSTQYEKWGTICNMQKSGRYLSENIQEICENVVKYSIITKFITLIALNFDGHFQVPIQNSYDPTIVTTELCCTLWNTAIKFCTSTTKRTISQQN